MAGFDSHVRFAAVIGHADDADVLRKCIGHHLGLGFQAIFVSLQRDDKESEEVVHEYATTKSVKGAWVDRYADDSFEFLTAALRALTEWTDPEWVMILDTDEFLVSAHADIAATSNLEQADVITIPRVNAPSVRNTDGSMRGIPPVDLSSLVVVKGNTSPLSKSAKWLTGNIMPKVLVRPNAVERIRRGGHAVIAKTDAVRQIDASDLTVVHFPFTTAGRFARKVAAIREQYLQVGERMFPPGEAMHWRLWLDRASAGELQDEFERQVVRAEDLEHFRRINVVATVAEVFAATAAQESKVGRV